MSEIKYIKKRTTRNALETLRPDASDYDTDEEYSAAWDMWADCCTVIDGATPADVAPVVRGWWLDDVDGKYYGRCFNCAKVAYKTSFCPHCGAKMDESEDKQ